MSATRLLAVSLASLLWSCFVDVPDRQDLCGDGERHDLEPCDDGNEVDLDGCHECRITEFRVSSDETGDLAGGARVAFSPLFGFHVLYSSQDSDGDSFGILGQRYDELGLGQGSPVTLNEDTAGGQQLHGAASVPDVGYLAAAWADYFAFPDVSTSNIVFNLFTSAMTSSPEVVVNDSPAQLSMPSITVFDSCTGSCAGQTRIVVSWVAPDGDGLGIHARCYDWHLDPVGSAFVVNTFTTGIQSRSFASNIDSTTGGDFVIAWQSNGQESPAFGVYARRFDASCSPLDATEFKVSQGEQASLPAVAMNEGGEMVFAYVCPPALAASTEWDVCARRWNFGGGSPVPLVDEFRVHPAGGSEPADLVPVVDVNSGGSFVVAWERWTSGADYSAANPGTGLGIQAVLFPPGASDASEGTPVATYHIEGENPSTASVALADDGRFVIAWGSGATYEDDVFAQKYDAAGMPLGSRPWE